MDEVRRGVGLARRATVGRVHDARRGLADADIPLGHLDRVAHETGNGLLDVEDLQLEAGADDHALVGHLPARLRIQRGLRQDHLGDLTLCGAVDGYAVHEKSQHGRRRLEVGVPGEDGLPQRTELPVHAVVGEGALARLRVGLRARALLLHERVERSAVDRQPGLFGDLEGEVDREAVRVVQQECLRTADRGTALGLRLLDG